MKYLITYGIKALQDYLKYHPWSARLASYGLQLLGQLRRRQPVRALSLFVRAARACPDSSQRVHLEALLQAESARLDLATLDWSAASAGKTDSRDVPKAIILKAPVSAAEKGFLYVTFEDQWLRLLRSGRAAAIAERYHLLLGPTWSPPHDVALLLAARFWPGPVYSLLSNLEDGDAMRRLSGNLMPIPLLASSWVDPDVYRDHLGAAREHDVVMVANFAPYKRHWLFFQMLRGLPRRFKVLVLGVPLGARTEKVLMEEARAFGVQDRFELRTRLSDVAIAEGLCRSRVSLIFSGQEGSCIAVVESLFADTPVGLFREARIGSKAYINEQTGVLLERRQVARQVQHFIETSQHYRPRAWALNHITCVHSHAILNDALRSAALRRGEPWTRDIARIYQNSLPRYLDPETAAEMQPWYEDFAECYGIRLGAVLAAPRVPVTATGGVLAR